MELGRICLLAIVAFGLVWCPTGGHAQCQDKYRMIPGHTACLPPSGNLDTAKPRGVTSQDQVEILKAHNLYRGVVRPPAANMQKMVWDEELEEIAQYWAENCIYHHDGNGNRRIPGRFAVGQNLAINYKDWNTTVEEWFIEYKNFKLNVGKIDSNPKKLIGHYVQLAYATAARIGCGIATCNYGMKALHDYDGTATLYVCNYAFGVTDKKAPYKEGAARCEDCPGHCVDGLCDCGGKVCENGGTLNLTNCECTCQQSFAVPEENCGLDCGNSKAKDQWYCKTNFKFPQCLATANLADQCPELCQVCPWAGFNYTDGSVPIATTTTSAPLTTAVSPTSSPATSKPVTATTPASSTTETTTATPIATQTPTVSKPVTATTPASSTTKATTSTPIATQAPTVSKPVTATTPASSTTEATTSTPIATQTPTVSKPVTSTTPASSTTEATTSTPIATQTPNVSKPNISPMTTQAPSTANPSTSAPSVTPQPTSSTMKTPASTVSPSSTSSSATGTSTSRTSTSLPTTTAYIPTTTTEDFVIPTVEIPKFRNPFARSSASQITADWFLCLVWSVAYLFFAVCC